MYATAHCMVVNEVGRKSLILEVVLVKSANMRMGDLELIFPMLPRA